MHYINGLYLRSSIVTMETGRWNATALYRYPLLFDILYLMYLLTANMLTPGGSSTIHIYT